MRPMRRRLRYSLKKLKELLRERLHMLYTKREAMFGPQLMRELERRSC